MIMFIIINVFDYVSLVLIQFWFLFVCSFVRDRVCVSFRRPELEFSFYFFLFVSKKNIKKTTTKQNKKLKLNFSATKHFLFVMWLLIYS